MDKLIKIADKISNVKDLVGEPPAEWDAKRIEEYIVFARLVVDGARGVNRALENYFEGVALAAEESISGSDAG